MWRWIVAGALIGLSGALALVYMFSKNKQAGKLAADLVEAAHRPEIEKIQNELKNQTGTLEERLKDTREKQLVLDQKKAELKAVYDITDMPRDEVIERLKKLNLG